MFQCYPLQVLGAGQGRKTLRDVWNVIPVCLPAAWTQFYLRDPEPWTPTKHLPNHGGTTMSRVLPLSLTLVAMVEVGCTDGPLTAPQPAARVPSTPAAYVGDAPTVPHVMRFEGRTIAGWYDTARN